MAWIESHEEVGEHHKTLQLSEQLKCNVPTAVGHLHLLWHYTLKVAWKVGDLSKQGNKAIARACWWDGDADLFVKALQDSGYLDGYLVHEWKEYAKHIIYQRQYNIERRKNKKVFPLSSCKTHVTTVATLPDLTRPYLTRPKELTTNTLRAKFSKPTSQEVTDYAKTQGFDLDGSHFCDYYESKGWVIGKQPMKDWKAAVRTWKKNGFNAQGDAYATRNDSSARGYMGATPIANKYAALGKNRQNPQDDQFVSGSEGLPE